MGTNTHGDNHIEIENPMSILIGEVRKTDQRVTLQIIKNLSHLNNAVYDNDKLVLPPYTYTRIETISAETEGFESNLIVEININPEMPWMSLHGKVWLSVSRTHNNSDVICVYDLSKSLGQLCSLPKEMSYEDLFVNLYNQHPDTTRVGVNEGIEGYYKNLVASEHYEVSMKMSSLCASLIDYTDANQNCLFELNDPAYTSPLLDLSNAGLNVKYKFEKFTDVSDLPIWRVSSWIEIRDDHWIKHHDFLKRIQLRHERHNPVEFSTLSAFISEFINPKDRDDRDSYFTTAHIISLLTEPMRLVQAGSYQESILPTELSGTCSLFSSPKWELDINRRPISHRENLIMRARRDGRPSDYLNISCGDIPVGDKRYLDALNPDFDQWNKQASEIINGKSNKLSQYDGLPMVNTETSEAIYTGQFFKLWVSEQHRMMMKTGAGNLLSSIFQVKKYSNNRFTCKLSYVELLDCLTSK